MGSTATAPAITTTDIGGKLANLGSKMDDGLKVAGEIGARVGILATAIFSSQQLGVDSDKIPGVTGKPQEGGINNPGVMMGGQTQTQSQSKAAEKDATCTADNPNCKDKEFHRGKIQAQEGSGMLVNVPSGHNWGTQFPPTYGRVAFCLGVVRSALEAQRPSVASNKALKLVGGDRADPFQTKADIATVNMIEYLKNNMVNGITAVVQRSFYFNGKQGNGKNGPTVGPQSRRIDIDINKGEIMGPRAR